MRVDVDGNLFSVHRKDVIKTGGMNVSSVEVERVLASHSSVERATVVGVPAPYWSEAVTAFVVLKEAGTATSDELLDHARSNLAAYKAPKAVHVVKELPADSQGKILQRVLCSSRPL